MPDQFGIPTPDEEALQDPLFSPGEVPRPNLKQLAALTSLIGATLGPRASKIALHPYLMDPKRFKTVSATGKPYDIQKFPVSAKVRVEFDDGEAIEDAVKGLSMGHALRRAADNWESAKRIQIIGVEPLEEVTKFSGR